VIIAADVSPVPGVPAIRAITLAELQLGVVVARNADVRADRGPLWRCDGWRSRSGVSVGGILAR
jgi:hypothetical protein